MKTFFTSDPHFGHKNIIRYCNRPFHSVEDMDDKLIKNWNKRVTPQDRVFVLGDFSFSSPSKYLSCLNGKVHFIYGNHDSIKYWERNNSVVRLGHYHEEEIEGTFIVMCHYAMRVWNKSHHGSLMLYGHSHSNLPGNSQSLDVGVDCWGYEPVTLDEIKKRMETLPLYQQEDHHHTGTNP